ncbi:response regulator [Frigoriflavimonas asaccharolytica]|uniref:DNA-binding NarL/FixJ family response regulator n=1 Tax=Frigoriflavimonas asaccharolytica TaxID=2735899 RepID=A0A8J8G5S5_9FLAO|nr:response regulator [Frigoriflavimonas asaccharolytica]NRS91250.1 DNA-binding NarL/FixJ family response regulator [Frigoriflavimonas asaccharolytica]
MYHKVLAVEDFESASISVQKALDDLDIKNVVFANYCDQAFEIFNDNFEENSTFDLLITDLSFDEDNNVQEIKSGIELIKKIREISQDVKIIVFSTERRSRKINELFTDLKIDGFVSKGRMDVQELKKAILEISEDNSYISQENLFNIKQTDTLELSNLEYAILQLLSSGILQKNISIILKERNLKPNSLSSLEKILNQLKETFSAKSNEQLIAKCKDLGIL